MTLKWSVDILPVAHCQHGRVMALGENFIPIAVVEFTRDTSGKRPPQDWKTSPTGLENVTTGLEVTPTGLEEHLFNTGTITGTTIRDSC